MKKQIIIALATLTALPAVSQEKWDLRKCIDYAIEHNLSIKQQEAARDQNAVDLNTAKYSRLPNLNGNVGQSFNFGRALQADNTYGDRNTKNTNFSLSTSIPLFTGLRIPNNIALSKLNLKAARPSGLPPLPDAAFCSRRAKALALPLPPLAVCRIIR